MVKKVKEWFPEEFEDLKDEKNDLCALWPYRMGKNPKVAAHSRKSIMRKKEMIKNMGRSQNFKR